MKALFLLVLFSSQLIACGGSSSSDDAQTISCTGFTSPNISVSVLDSQSDESLNTARVDVIYTDSNAASAEATYDSQMEAYVGLLPSEEYKSLTVVVSADNYHSSVSKHQALIEDTSCGAKNTLAVTVYLCATGTACI